MFVSMLMLDSARFPKESQKLHSNTDRYQIFELFLTIVVNISIQGLKTLLFKIALIIFLKNNSCLLFFFVKTTLIFAM